MIENFEALLDKYAHLLMRVGLNVQVGQRVWLTTPLELAPFSRLLVKHAYLLGASYVHVEWKDADVDFLRLKYGSAESLKQYPDWEIEGRASFMRNNDGRMTVYAESADKLAEIDPLRIQTVRAVTVEKSKPLRALFNSGQGGFWAVVSGASADWAASVFPDLSPAAGVEKLWELIFAACRVYEADPVAVWQKHCEDLAQRSAYLTQKAYTELHYRSAETDLRIGLPANHRWDGGADWRNGIPFAANMPTEEVFTLPDRLRVDGYITSTKPLSFAGKLMPKFTLHFEQGKVVKVTAQENESHLNNLLDTDEGARYLGEVALVPHSSPISQTGVLFYNALYDENAACHLAFGNAYRSSLVNGESMSDEDFAAAGGNMSGLHMDFMVGSADLDIDGTLADGSVEPVLRNGEWAF